MSTVQKVSIPIILVFVFTLALAAFSALYELGRANAGGFGYAATSEPSMLLVVGTATSDLGGLLIKLLEPTVLVVASYVGLKIASWFKRKTHIDISKQVDRILDLAIDYAEGRASDWLKATGGKMASHKKLEVAMDFAYRKLKESKLVTQASDALAADIEALLQQRRPTAFADGTLSAVRPA